MRATATHPSSPPAETLLFPEDTTAPGVFWHSAALKADILVALSCLAAVCRVGVQAGPLGFVVGDAPVLRVSAGESMASMQLVGEWRLCKGASLAFLYGATRNMMLMGFSFFSRQMADEQRHSSAESLPSIHR